MIKNYQKWEDWKINPVQYDLWNKMNSLILELEHIRAIDHQIKFRTQNVSKFAKFCFIVKAHCNLMCEHTWFFETTEQAKKAYEMFKNTELDGWFYSIEELDSTIQDYLENFGYKPRIDWL